MSFIQMSVYAPSTNFAFARPRGANAVSSVVSVAPLRSRLLPKITGELSFRSPAGLGSFLPDISLRLSRSVLEGKRSSVCYVGGNNEPPSWNPFEEGMEIEDVLRQQMLKKEYADGGSGGGGLFGGGSSGGGDSEDDDFQGMLHEFWEVIFATVGFIFLYVLIIDGEEITRMGSDIFKFIFTRKKSLRLTRTIDRWEIFFRQLGVKEWVDPYWLERRILRTNTWWDGPSKYRRNTRDHPAPRYE